VLPKQIVAATPWLSQIWYDIRTLEGKPNLIVWGMKDIAFRQKELKRWERTFPEARSISLSSVGRYVREESPRELEEAVVTFLAQTAQA
jgi:haloalkane dehalogenase